MNQLMQAVEADVLKKSLPQVDVGDTVKMFVKIKEGGKERVQGYEGVVIKRRGTGVSETITVRRVFQGVGIERVFFLHSPRIEKISVQRKGHVRRAKLYYQRKRTGKATRIREQFQERSTVGANSESALTVAAATPVVETVEIAAPAETQAKE